MVTIDKILSISESGRRIMNLSDDTQHLVNKKVSIFKLKLEW
jgi:hypothetical protein